MRATHSIAGDSAYIYLKEVGAGEAVAQHLVEDERIPAMVLLDLDADGRLIGIEVIGAAAALPSDLLNEAEQIDT
jgi:uncharacterized protein YuzE